MVSIPGRFEYDDESLRPGQKKEGGLHSNLYDSDGNLKGNARFIPDDVKAGEPANVSDVNGPEDWQGRSYWSDEDEEEDRRRREDQEDGAIFLTVVGVGLGYIAIKRWGPHAVRLWNERTRPAISTGWAQVRRRPKPSASVPAGEETPEAEIQVVDSSLVADLDRQYLRNMDQLKAALAEAPAELAAPSPEPSDLSQSFPIDESDPGPAGLAT